jgi:membrane-associated phospholipid phosphatase
MNMNKLFRFLRPTDLLIIIFINCLSLLSVLFFFGSSASNLIVVINLIVTVLILTLSFNIKDDKRKLLRIISEWYPIPMIFFIFKEVHVIIQSLGRNDWDNLLINIDRTIFGCDPTVWLANYSHPILTEILQISYASYYFIMLVVGMELYLRKEYEEFNFAVFTIVYGFVLSYIGYLLFPAVGPRFTLHDFYSMNTDLPGIWLTTTIRDLINAGESIPRGAINAMALAQRDVFPSGHTQMTLISMYLALQYKIKSRYIIYILGVLLIFSTVYLRYHYVVDVIGGILFMIFTLWSAPKLFKPSVKIKNNI